MDFINWTFTTAAQSISTFMAFLLTGYAIVINIMDVALERDETLEDVHTELRKQYHRSLIILAVITGSAIILNLFLVFINREEIKIHDFIIISVLTIDFFTIVAGLFFVITDYATFFL